MSKTIRPYLALDLETTGVNTDKAHILEVGAVIEDGVSPISELKTLSCIIDAKSFDYSEPFAMNLNAEILKQIAKGDGSNLAGTLTSLRNMAEEAGELALAWDEKNGVARPSNTASLGGKNIGMFDFPILKANIERLAYESEVSSDTVHELEAFFGLGETRQRPKIKYRVVDLGNIFYTDFGYVPSQDEIMNLLGWEQVSHRALDDAFQVVKAVRYKMGYEL